LSGLQQCRHTPIINLTDHRLIFLLGGGKLDAIKGAEPKDTSTLLGVHPTTVRELFWSANHMTKGRKMYADRFAAQVFEDGLTLDAPIVYKCKGWIDQPIAESTQKERIQSDSLLTVNLALPDKILIEHFEKFLKECRAKNKSILHKPKRRRESFYKDWIAFGVLPFIDLQIWAKEEGLTIPKRVIADAIFSAGDGGEEVVRKTTEPLASKLLGRRNLDILEAKAASELAESYKGNKFPEKNS
jgi:hypothetical protein